MGGRRRKGLEVAFQRRHLFFVNSVSDWKPLLLNSPHSIMRLTRRMADLFRLKKMTREFQKGRRNELVGQHLHSPLLVNDTGSRISTPGR